MKAILLKQFGGSEAFEMGEVALPTPKKGEVRIRIKAVGFNPVDYKIRKGEFGGNCPVILGADCAGLIDEIGEEVSGWKKGDEVIAFVFGQGSNGTYAEYVCISTAFVARKPKTMSFEEAAAVPLVGLTAYRALANAGCLSNEKSIFIAGGAGGVGSIALQIAKAFGCKRIFTLAGGEDSLHYLKDQMGLCEDHILMYRGLSWQQMAERLIQMNQSLFSASFDFVGGEMKDLCLEVADFQGHMVSIVPESDAFPCNLWARGKSPAFRKNLAVHFVFVGAESFGGQAKDWACYQKQLGHIAKLIEEKKLRLPSPKIVGALSVESVRQAHQELEGGKVKGKLAMTVD
jgi:NADPH:quinone reductase